MKLRKLFVTSIAALMAVSALGISASAEENKLLATLTGSNGELIEVYEDDVTENGYSVNYGDITITIDGERSPWSRSLSSVMKGTFRTSKPNSCVNIYPDEYDLSFSVTSTQPRYTPYCFTPGVGTSSLEYIFKADAEYKGYLYATVYCVDNPAYNPVTLYLNDTEEHSVKITGMTNGNQSYAKMTNSGYSKATTGSCYVEN